MSYSIDDSPDTVPTSVAGERYAAASRVAAASSSSVGKPATLVIREKTATGTYVRETRSSPVTLATAFQRVTVTARAARSADVVDVYLIQEGAAAGDAFDVDAFTLLQPAETLEFGVHSHLSWDTYSPTQRETVLTRLRQAHVRWIRIDVGWNNFQPCRGCWDDNYAARIDGIVNGAHDRGMNVLAVLWSTPKWASGSDDPHVPPRSVGLRRLRHVDGHPLPGPHPGVRNLE